MAILDLNGKPIRSSKKRPITDEIAVVTIRDRWSSYPSEGLTPEKLARIFKEADAGDVYRQMELFEEIEEKDCHLFAELQKRKQAVLSLDYEVIPYSESRIDKKAAQLVQDALEFEGFEDAILDILDAIGKGYSVCEIMWSILDSQAKVNRLKWVHQKRFTFGDFPQGNPDEIRLLTEGEPVRGIELPPDKFIVHKYKARSGHPSRAGVIRVCTWMYLFKNYNIKDWVTFAEVYGMPLRLGKYDAHTSPEDKEKLIQAVVQLGTDAAGIISKDTEIEFVQAVKSADNIYEALANFCNREMSKAILGQTLTAEVGDKGSYAASQTHNEVRKDLLKADTKALAETLRKDLFRPLVRFNIGDEPKLPWLKFDLSEPEDQEKTARVYSILIGECGLPVSSKHVYEKFAIPEPEEGEEILASPRIGGLGGLGFKALKGTPSYPNPQREVDSLADKGREMVITVMERLLEPLVGLFASGADLEEIRDRLPEIFSDMDTVELEELIGRVMFIADLYGRWIADEKY